MIVPVDVPLVTAGQPAQTDASGNFTSVSMIHPANWSVVRLVGQTTGYPKWVLNSDNNLPLDFASGAQCSMGLILVAPGQRLTTQILAALPAVSVSGHFVGVMSPDLNEVLPFYLPSPNSIGSAVSAPPQTVISIVNNDSTTHTVPVPAGGVCVGYAAGQLTVGPTTQITITGHQTLITYISDVGSQISFGPQVMILDSADTSIDCRVTAGSGPGSVDFLVWTVPLAVFVQQRPGAQLTVISGPPANWQSPLSTVNVAVTLNQVGAGDTAVIIPAVVGQTVRLWDVSLSIDTPVATGAVQMETTAPVSIHGFGVSLANCNPFRGNGVPLAGNMGVRLRNLMAANPAVMRGSMVYTQA